MKQQHYTKLIMIAMLSMCAGLAWADADYPPHGRVSFDTGGLLVQSAEEAEWASASVNALVVPGDTLWVEEEGMAELEISGANFVRLADRSKAEITALSPQIFIRGWVGSFYVHRFGSNEESFIFTTPAATVDIAHDSIVRLDISETGALTVSVHQGSAAVHTDLGGDVSAQAGFRVWVDPGYMPSDAVAFDSSKGDAFDEWNNSRGRVLAESVQTTPREVAVSSATVGVYDLPRYGEWVTIDSRPYWRPTVVANYEPYRYGYWNYMPSYGHVWVDEYPFAYVTSHYGRWRHAPSYGWVWSYDPVWGPAWVVSMRAGDYFTWAPMDYYYRPVLVYGASTFMMGGLSFSWSSTRYSHYSHLYWGSNYIYQPAYGWVSSIGLLPSRDFHVWNLGFRGNYRPSIPFGRDFLGRARDYKPTSPVRGIPTSIFGGLSPRERAGSLESRLGRNTFAVSRPEHNAGIRTASLGNQPLAGTRRVSLRQTEQTYLPSRPSGGTGADRATAYVPESQRLRTVREQARNQTNSGRGGPGMGQAAPGTAQSGRQGNGQPSGRGMSGSGTGPARTNVAVRDLESSSPAPRGSGQITRTVPHGATGMRQGGGSAPTSGRGQSAPGSSIRTSPAPTQMQTRPGSGAAPQSQGRQTPAPAARPTQTRQGAPAPAPAARPTQTRPSPAPQATSPRMSAPGSRSTAGTTPRAPSSAVQSPRPQAAAPQAPRMSSPAPRPQAAPQAPRMSSPAPRPQATPQAPRMSSPAPSFSAPAQRAPSFSAPAQRAPSFSAPAQRAPSFSAPAQRAPSFSAPAQRAPSFSAPAQRAPSFSAPRSGSSFSAPRSSGSFGSGRSSGSSIGSGRSGGSGLSSRGSGGGLSSRGGGGMSRGRR